MRNFIAGLIVGLLLGWAMAVVGLWRADYSAGNLPRTYASLIDLK